MDNEDIINKYEKNYLFYERFRGLVEDYTRNLLDTEQISFHSITSRTKTIESLTKKIELKHKYQELKEITDLVGIRIITYYSDTVDQISKLIEKEFIVDKDNSIDKRKTIDPDRFGYRSLHYVVQINEGQIQFNTDFNYYNLKFEIQISSILQYTWAEIEHDLGYKSQEEIPYDIKRSFSRLASLLELADEEFLRIKNEIFAYKDQLMLSYLNAKLDKESLNVFKIKSPEFIDLISFFIKKLGAQKASQGNYKNIISMLKYLNLKTLQEVDNKLKQYYHLIKKYAYILYEDTTRSNLNMISGDIPLLYLCYFILVTEKNEDEFERFVDQFISSNGLKNRLIKLKKILKNV
ncbi:GTP pyrophosphokinase [Thomasclavelia sp.]